MSELKKRVKDDIKTAMKNKVAFKRDTLRAISTAIKQFEVDNRVELDDSGVESLLQKLIKQREDAARQYKEANRDDLYQKESNEIAILKEYLPKQLEEAELIDVVKDIIAKLNATSQKDMGRVMKEAKDTIGSKADGKRISEAVKSLLKG